MPGLDPGICFRGARDCRVEPGNDALFDAVPLVVFDDPEPGPARGIAPRLLAKARAVVPPEGGRPQFAAARLFDAIGRDQPQRTLDLGHQPDAGGPHEKVADAVLDTVQRRIVTAAEALLIPEM